MYEIIKSFGDTAFLAEKDGLFYVLKKVSPEETKLYKKLMQLNSDNVERVYSLTVQDGEFYAVCEFINGETLGAYFDRTGPLTDERVADITLQLCDGLEAVHREGIVHRDVNPNNIMIDAHGTVKLIDFGISRIRKPGRGTDTQFLGTQGFAPPEQYGFAQTDAGADIYSVGVVMNYLKTGKLPLEKTDTGAYSSVIVRCTQMDRINRYATVGELAARIRKKGKLKKALSYIPGFGTGVWWHRLFATVYFLITGLMVLTTVFEGEDSLRERLWNGLIVFLMFIAPVPILCNSGHWTEKLALTKNRTKRGKIGFRILFTSVVYFFACAIIIIFE